MVASVPRTHRSRLVVPFSIVAVGNCILMVSTRRGFPTDGVPTRTGRRVAGARAWTAKDDVGSKYPPWGHHSASSGVISITRIALLWIGSTTPLGSVVRNE